MILEIWFFEFKLHDDISLGCMAILFSGLGRWAASESCIQVSSSLNPNFLSSVSGLRIMSQSYTVYLSNNINDHAATALRGRRFGSVF